MKETHITIYIHDLEISDKSKSFLARVGLMKLDDLLNCNMTELSAMRNISEDVLQELNGVIAHSDVIISFFEERAKRIKEILPNGPRSAIGNLRVCTGLAGGGRWQALYKPIHPKVASDHRTRLGNCIYCSVQQSFVHDLES